MPRAVSTGGGQCWSVRSQYARFSGMPEPDGRSTGNLIAVDAVHGNLYAASYDQGVLRSVDDGATWTSLGLAGVRLRGLALDPADPEVLYVGTLGQGVYTTTSATGAGSLVALAGSPANAEEVAVAGGTVFVAGGAAGVFASSDGGQTWAQSGSSVVRSDGPYWL